MTSSNGHPRAPEPDSDRPDPYGAESPFPPIAELGFLSDCEATALIAPQRQRRVAVPSEVRLTECLRRDPRS